MPPSPGDVGDDAAVHLTTSRPPRSAFHARSVRGGPGAATRLATPQWATPRWATFRWAAAVPTLQGLMRTRRTSTGGGGGRRPPLRRPRPTSRRRPACLTPPALHVLQPVESSRRRASPRRRPACSTWRGPRARRRAATVATGHVHTAPPHLMTATTERRAAWTDVAIRRAGRTKTAAATGVQPP